MNVLFEEYLTENYQMISYLLVLDKFLLKLLIMQFEKKYQLLHLNDIFVFCINNDNSYCW